MSEPVNPTISFQPEIHYAEPGFFEFGGYLYSYGPGWCVLIGFVQPTESTADAVARIWREEHWIKAP